MATDLIPADLLPADPNTLMLLTAAVVAGLLLLAFALFVYYRGLRARECGAMQEIYGEMNGRLRATDPGDEEFQYPLRDYYIKSAYNCCSGGAYRNDYVDLCVLKALLRQGVRGLDMEIFSIDDQPVVATSTIDSYYVKETFNSVPFADVMALLRDQAFSGASAPNAADPVILHLRFKSSHMPMYERLAKILEGYDSVLLPKDYDSENYGANFGATPLQKLRGKVVILVDRSNPAFMECERLYRFVNMTSNSVFMRALHYDSVRFSPDMAELTEFNKQNMTIAMPDRGAAPPNPSAVVLRETGCQMLAMRYPLVDANVEESDAFFDERGTAFVLKPESLRYVPVTLPMPPAQDPALSYAPRTVQSEYYKFEI
jgi:hypothetical protein